MRESYIQSELCKKLRQAGFLVNALEAPPGWPDVRAFKNGRVIVVEVKQKGKKPRPLQEIMLEKFRQAGVEVYVLDNTKDIKKIINNG